MSRESEKNFLFQFSTDKNQCQKIAKTTKNKNNVIKKFQKLIQPAKNKNKSKSKTRKTAAKNKKPQDIVTNAIIYSCNDYSNNNIYILLVPEKEREQQKPLSLQVKSLKTAQKIKSKK